ncbi:MAG TPA: DNA polymerase/3'-5' exonuclease PolX [Elusimicrobia bacterium]|jgi:DNA polymerase (family 10)|nr:DNA polymerase/3'-5' exonuclease PolX [Elusimicrobiota bacterium]
MKNKEVAQLLYEIAELLSLSEENPFRIRAYERAAQVIEALPQLIEEITKKDELRKIPGIGEGIAEKIKEYLSTGRLKYIEDLKKKIPESVLEIMSISGMGPKKAKIVYDKLQITSIPELEKAVKEHQLASLPGFGEKTEENILKGIELKRQSSGRVLLFTALITAKTVVESLSKLPQVKQVAYAGSLRRGKETIRDIDILCTATKSKPVMDTFINLPWVREKLAQGETKSSVILEGGTQCDLRVVEPQCFGAALLYFTGSKEHNIALRTLANKKGYTINEYGLFKLKEEDKPLAGLTENDVYEKLGLQFIPPELRENRGEIEIAAKGKIPLLVEEKDIRGDLHVHSKYSDGNATIEQIAEQAKRKGWEWITICDHSQSLKVAGGVPVKEVYRKVEEIKRHNTKNKNFRILASMEVDIHNDGSLDYEDELLKELDFVIAAIHTGFKQSEEKITERISLAMENKYVNMIAHPTGRLLGKREPYAVNMEKILEKAKKTHTAIEINAFPERLDLYDIYCKQAKEMGIMLGIGTDAHTLEQFDYLGLGVTVARRGWLEKKNLLNTLKVDELLELIRKR